MEFYIRALTHVPIVVIGLLPIMNPLSTIPLFLALTKDMTARQQKQQALRASIYAFMILAAFLLVGNGIISLFGISLHGIRIAGGLIIMVLAFRMLFSGEGEANSIKSSPSEIQRAQLDFSFSPLAMPMLAGPGCIAVVLGYSSQIPEQHMLIGHVVVLIGILITAAVAYAALASATWIRRVLGEHGIQAVTKIMGFLLACIAVQFVASGVSGFVTSHGA